MITEKKVTHKIKCSVVNAMFKEYLLENSYVIGVKKDNSKNTTGEAIIETLIKKTMRFIERKRLLISQFIH